MLSREKMLEPKYLEFPVEEYKKRNEKARRLMDEKGIDALFITMKENIEYFTGYMVGGWDVIDPAAGVGIIPREGAPVLVVPDFLSGTAEATSWVRNIKTQFHGHSRPRGLPNVIVDTFKEMGLARGIIGYESGPELMIGMPTIDYEKVRLGLKDAKLVSGADIIWGCRSIKSPLEVERLEKANEITFKGHMKVRETAKVGMTEFEIAKIFKSVFVEEGSDGYSPNGLGYLNIYAGPERYPMTDSIPQDRKLRKGDILIMNCGTSYKGYRGHTARYAFVGKPTEKQKKVDRVITLITQAISEFLSPGLKGRDFVKYATDVITKAHIDISEFEFLTAEFPIGGICTGLNLHEHPRIAANLENSTEAGQCVTMTNWWWDAKPGGIGVFAWEHPFMITKAGNQPLAKRYLEWETQVI